MGRLLIWLSGAQPDILAQCKHDRPKYIGVGSAVLVTSSMAAVSMSFALHIALAAKLPVAIPFAVAWGLAIMSLDRWLVVSLVRQPPLRYFLLALPRLLLGLLFGIIISTPLTLQIFHVEIDNQIALDHTNALAAYNSSPAVTSLTKRITADKQAVSADQQVIDSDGAALTTAPSQDPTLVSLQKQLQSDQSQVTHYTQAAHCEQYGGSGCGIVVGGNVVLGSGTAYKTDESQLGTYNAKVVSDNQQIKAEQAQLATRNSQDESRAVGNAQSNLTRDKAKLAGDQASLDSTKSAYLGTLGKDTGILASLKALDELRGSSSTLMLADILLFLFFTAIEWLPILVKALLNLGPENTYEKLLAKEDEKSLRNAENESSRQYLASVRDMDVATEGGYRFNADWESDVLPDLMRDALAARERVARARLGRWEHSAASDTSRTSYDDIFTPGGGGRAPRTVSDWRPGHRYRAAGESGPVWPAGGRVSAAWRVLRRGESPRQRRRPSTTGPLPRMSEPY